MANDVMTDIFADVPREIEVAGKAVSKHSCWRGFFQ